MRFNWTSNGEESSDRKEQQLLLKYSSLESSYDNKLLFMDFPFFYNTNDPDVCLE